MPIDDDQRQRLRQAKLRAIVRDHFDDPSGEPAAYPSGAAFVAGDHGYVLVDDATERSAGGPVLWATRQGLGSLDVLVDCPGDNAPGDDAPGDDHPGDDHPGDDHPGSNTDVPGDLARRLALFDPAPRAWIVDGADVAPAAPAPRPAVLPAPEGAETLVGLLDAADLDVVVEDGIIRGEELGLEVARIVPDPDLAFRLEVGVGQFDQAAAAMMFADKPTAEALDAVVTTVRTHRHAGAPIHPVRDLCRERWLRHVVIADPSLIGAEALHAVESTVARRNLRDPHPAFAVGEAADGSPVVVACTYGVDVDLIALAVDVRDRESPGAELIVVSAGPLPASVHAVADRVPGTVRFVELPAPWA